MKKKRNYRHEYDAYQGRPDQIKERAKRNAARREMVKKGKAHKGDGLDVAHVDNNEYNNDPANLAMWTKKHNRAIHPREKKRRK